MMKRNLLLLPIALMLWNATVAWAQDADSDKTLTWHGFVNPHMYLDSRQVVSGRENMMLFFPEPVVPDADGNDLNSTAALKMMSITTRLNLTVKGPDVMGARTRAFIEGDFTGSTDATINNLRLRHAYIDMQWQNQSLLMGQYWYPMVVHEIMPGTNPLNMGAPFHPYARYSQLRYTQCLSKLEAVAVASFQLDNKSKGPEESLALSQATLGSTDFQSRSLIPELHLQLRYKGERLFLGAAANMLTIKPRNYVLDTNNGKHSTSKTVTTFAYSLFGSYRFDGWVLKAQTLLNDNLYESCTMGGYYETRVLAGDIYRYSYDDWTYTTAWVDFGRTTGKWRPGVFLGYAVNNDYSSLNDVIAAGAAIYGRGFDIKKMYRVQPRLVYQTDKGLMFQAEAEYSAALYRTPLGTTHSEEWADNMRLSISAVYSF